MEPSAKIIADSISLEGVRLTTFEVVFHRFVLAEMNTSRVFSRNSASSRAIPFRKQVEKVKNDLAMPLSWPQEQKGMQGGEPLDDQALAQAQSNWDKASGFAIEAAEAIASLGVHKSVVNRLLEPFMWHTAVITATGYENFFSQRCSPMAQPEIRAVADLMKAEYDKSEPEEMSEGGWHLPYVSDEDLYIIRANVGGRFLSDAEKEIESIRWATSISAARCARVSYLTQDGKRDMNEDMRLYARLTEAKPPHWSPLEHVATPWAANRQDGSSSLWVPTPDGKSMKVPTRHLPRVGNLLGWRSLRTEVETLQGELTYR